MSTHVLIVDDDIVLRRSLAFSLEKAGYRLTTAASAEEALTGAQSDPPDLVLFDTSLSGTEALGVLPQFRKRLNAPIIVLAGHKREMDEALGLELGADDYVAQPFDLDVLLARVKAVLRRSGAPRAPARPASLSVGDLTIDPQAHTLRIAGRKIQLSPREFDLLYALAREADYVVSADNLLERVWGPEYEGEPQVVYVYIRKIREKLERDPGVPQRILTVRGVGYKLKPQAA